MSLRQLTQDTQEVIFDFTLAAPRYGLPSGVTFTPVLAKQEVASARKPCLVTSHVLDGLVK